MTLSEAQAQRLIRLYSEAERELLRELNKALLKGNNTDNLQALLRNTRKIRADLLAGGREWCEKVVPILYQEAANATGLPEVAAHGTLHQQAMQVLAENAYSRLQQVDQVVGRRIDDIYRDMALEAVRGDVAGYRTWTQTAKLYRQKLAEKGITGFVDAAGKEWNLKTYAEMVARTTTREVMIQGTANRLLEHGRDLAEIIGGRGQNTCTKCSRWVGRTVSLTGKTAGYPTLAEARSSGLFHGNCTHNIAITGTFEEEIAKAKRL
jgi:hypothetical protein